MYFSPEGEAREQGEGAAEGHRLHLQHARHDQGDRRRRCFRDRPSPGRYSAVSLLVKLNCQIKVTKDIEIDGPIPTPDFYSRILHLQE